MISILIPNLSSKVSKFQTMISGETFKEKWVTCCWKCSLNNGCCWISFIRGQWFCDFICLSVRWLWNMSKDVFKRNILVFYLCLLLRNGISSFQPIRRVQMHYGIVQAPYQIFSFIQMYNLLYSQHYMVGEISSEGNIRKWMFFVQKMILYI